MEVAVAAAAVVVEEEEVVVEAVVRLARPLFKRQILT